MKTITHNLQDNFGPQKILELWQPNVGLRAIVVVDNTACGPAIGGVRMAPDVDVEEVARLARAMSYKNTTAGLAFGGGKAGIVADPDCDSEEKERLIRTFAHEIRDLVDYIPGPDMGTDETCMAWVHDEIGRAVGLPRVLGGIPLDEIGATGYGLAIAAEVAAPVAGIDLAGARVVIQGFGAVGQHAARFLVERGARLVAVADSRGALLNPNGLDVDSLIAHKRSGAQISLYAEGLAIERDALVDVECDIWIPAARPDVLHVTNVGRLRAKLVLPGANIPATAGAELWMHENGILYVPDFIANAGGVICATVEYRGGTEAQAMASIEEKIRANVAEVLDRVRRSNLSPEEAAIDMARERIEQAESYRRFWHSAQPRGAMGGTASGERTASMHLLETVP